METEEGGRVKRGEGGGEAGSFGRPAGLEGAGTGELPGGAEEVVPISGSGWGGPGRGVEMPQRELVPQFRVFRVPDSNTWGLQPLDSGTQIRF